MLIFSVFRGEKSNDIKNTGELFNYSGKYQYLPAGTDYDGIDEIKYGLVRKKHLLNNASIFFNGIERLSKKDYKYFKNLKYLVIDCLWYKNHPSHFNFEKSLKNRILYANSESGSDIKLFTSQNFYLVFYSTFNIILVF